jgi:hypothetical protein
MGEKALSRQARKGPRARQARWGTDAHHELFFAAIDRAQYLAYKRSILMCRTEHQLDARIGPQQEVVRTEKDVSRASIDLKEGAKNEKSNVDRAESGRQQRLFV